MGVREQMKLLSSPAKIIGVDIASSLNIVKIDQGKKHGIKPGMVALSEGCVAGRIIESSFYFSTVMLISDPKSSIAALIQRNRVRGILKGRGRGICHLNYIKKDVDVRVGDNIITSGLDGIFPKGLPLGKVAAVTKGKTSDIFQTIKVEPYIDVNKLEEVVMLVNVRSISD